MFSEFVIGQYKTQIWNNSEPTRVKASVEDVQDRGFGGEGEREGERGRGGLGLCAGGLQPLIRPPRTWPGLRQGALMQFNSSLPVWGPRLCVHMSGGGD